MRLCRSECVDVVFSGCQGWHVLWNKHLRFLNHHDTTASPGLLHYKSRQIWLPDLLYFQEKSSL